MANDYVNDVLQEIELEKWPKLRDLFKREWPYYIYIYYYIDMSYQWRKKHNYDIKFYSPAGQWEVDGTFITFAKDSNHIVFCSLDKKNQRLIPSLSNTKRINWNEKLLMFIIHKDQFNLIFQIPREKNFHITHFTPAGYWWIPKEKALEYEVTAPEGTYLGTLSTKHTAQVFNVWPHRLDSNISYIEEMLANNGGCGLFDKNDDSLMAWITRNDYGALGILQTEEKHKRKGYASIVTKYFSKQLALNGIDPTCYIVIKNSASEILFTKLGFSVVSYMCWAAADKI